MPTPVRGDSAILVQATDLGIRFGALQALDGVDLTIRTGECLGLVGHNGAGKSTLINVINGTLPPHVGQLSYGRSGTETGVRAARQHGIRCVFQELSLFPDLSIAENVRIITQSGLVRWGWRKSALLQLQAKLDEIFPDHRINCRTTVAELGLAQQQMVEIAINFLVTPQRPRLVILDEPTSSLDASVARQLLDFVCTFVAQGGAVILISHMLDEILTASTRIIVMKNGSIVANFLPQNCSKASLIAAMGNTATPAETGQQQRTHQHNPIVLTAPSCPQTRPPTNKTTVTPVFQAHQGEIIGLAGLAGHGQSDMLLALYAQHRTAWWFKRDSPVEFIAGDRRLNGIFPLWRIVQNLSIASLHTLAHFGLISNQKEIQLGLSWQKNMAIKTPDISHNILSLSGGNQQKVLFARALATTAPVILMDDPMRGVDVGTKDQVYEMIRHEADRGRTFIWYSTEMAEIERCDRVYVFRNHNIVAEFRYEAITESNIIAASFSG